jgi:thiol-disulfide isomerase/thioredoxin
MKNLFTLLVALNLFISAPAQQNKTYFSDAVSLHIKKYIENCENAILDQNYERVQDLFDSLVRNHLNGTFIEDLAIKKLSGGMFRTKDIEKPFILTTTSSWFIKNEEEIDAINQLASEFKGKVDIVVLFWDAKANIKKIAKKYRKDVIITYVDENSNQENDIINTYKHALGFPTAFYITSEKKIARIDRGGIVKFEHEGDQTLYANNYKKYHNNMLHLLIRDNLVKNTILTDTD